MTEFCNDKERWRKLPLTITARATLYKMITLLKLLYILQNTPYYIPGTYFNNIARSLRTLLLDGNTPRVALKTQYQSVYNGGLALLGIRAYHRVAQLYILNDWGHSPHSEPAYSIQ